MENGKAVSGEKKPILFCPCERHARELCKDTTALMAQWQVPREAFTRYTMKRSCKAFNSCSIRQQRCQKELFIVLEAQVESVIWWESFLNRRGSAADIFATTSVVQSAGPALGPYCRLNELQSWSHTGSIHTAMQRARWKATCAASKLETS